MQRTHIYMLVALMVGMGLAATPVLAQGRSSSSSDMEFGIGGAFTQFKDANGMIPVTLLKFEKVTVEFGVNLFSGNGTNFGLQAGGFFHPYEFDHGKVGFGLQFNLVTIGNAVANQAGTTAGVIGLGSEYRVAINNGVDIGLRIFPFQLMLLSGGAKTQFGLFAPGMMAGFYF